MGIDWTKGFSASYDLTRVDRATWRDVGHYNLESGSIDRNYDDNLMESASLKLNELPGSNEEWVRVYLIAKQDGTWQREALFTGLTSIPSKSVEGNRISYDVKCYSVLKPADDILLPIGWNVTAGASGGEVVKNLLSVCSAPVYLDSGSPGLEGSIVAERGETNLSMAWVILDAINWRLRILGDGSIYISPKDENVKATFGNLENDIVEPSFTDDNDWYSCPNVLRVIYNDDYVEVSDETSDKLSIAARGREVWAQEDAELNSGESLYEYARRRLLELQQTSRKIKYTRRFDPSITVGDYIRLNYPKQNLKSIFGIESQGISLEFGCPVNEEAVEIEYY